MTPEKFYTYIGVHGNKIVHRWIDADGNAHISLDDSHDYRLYIPDHFGTHTGLYKTKLTERLFSSPKEMSEWYRQNQDYIKIHGMNKPEYQYIADVYPDRPVHFDFTKIKIVNVDIETEIGNGFPDPDLAEQEINSITCSLIGTEQSITFTTCDYDESLDIDKHANNKIVLCGDERELAQKFLMYWNEVSPDAITGWNIIQFDIPYIINRFAPIVGKLINVLSPISTHAYNPLRKVPHKVTGKDEYKIAGLAILDYLEVYRKFNFSSPPDFRLETIAQIEVGEGKIDYGQYASLKEFYLNDPTRFVRYNIKDVMLINKMERKLNYLLLAYTLMYSAKCNCNDIFGQVKFWDIYIYNFLKNQGIQIPPSKNIPAQDVEGAYVAVPTLGKSNWVISFDLTSLN